MVAKYKIVRARRQAAAIASALLLRYGSLAPGYYATDYTYFFLIFFMLMFMLVLMLMSKCEQALSANFKLGKVCSLLTQFVVYFASFL